ncbi:MAG TPA: Asp-tRNA(Asn)/Glu-tRNA(Gln) amidotransferase subunit GatB [Candidatus Paceibacterota bacterium]|nr:Asp-tRNA(Asn)/Glu-tRNA(Gln) amidotransferase subunit GatB [Candidatus Paceibacterota bacterium]
MSREYVPTIGLEIHAELRTNTKMFCQSKNDPDETRPNVNVCPVCLAHPGTLPVINGEAVRHVLKVGVALGSTLADYTEFDRKNYFYPDLPKGYQLSQYEYPLVSGGALAGVSITRVHLEEDTASSVHDEETGETSIDYNRAGVPLMELVTEPVITSAEQAGNFARELQLLLRTLGVSEANMEKGEMRVEANVSIAPKGERGTKVEIKNLNSFNAMERAVRFEIERQKEILDRGEKVVQQTLGWNEKKQATFPQRSKEGSADYRYFPDPDLPSLKLSEIPSFGTEALKEGMPELPWERRARYMKLGIKAEDAETFVREEELGRLFEAAVSQFGEGDRGVQLAANYIANDLVNIFSSSAIERRDIGNRDTGTIGEIPISSQNFNKIIVLIRDGKISSRAAKDMLVAYAKGEQEDPEAYVQTHALSQENASSKIKEVVEEVLKANPSVVADFRSGKQAALEYLLGQCMKALRGAADPVGLRTALKDEISRL